VPQPTTLLRAPATYYTTFRTFFEAALNVVKGKKPRTTPEVHILQSAVDMVETALGEYILSKMHVIPLSYNKISLQISMMPNNVNEQLTNMLKTGKKFAINLDANWFCKLLSTHDLCTSIFYISNVMEAEILLREQMTPYTTGEDIFQLFKKFAAESSFKRFKCIIVIMKGATATTVQHTRLV
jgi:hypothetical protein